MSTIWKKREKKWIKIITRPEMLCTKIGKSINENIVRIEVKLPCLLHRHFIQWCSDCFRFSKYEKYKKKKNTKTKNKNVNEQQRHYYFSLFRFFFFISQMVLCRSDFLLYWVFNDKNGLHYDFNLKSIEQKVIDFGFFVIQWFFEKHVFKVC